MRRSKRSSCASPRKAAASSSARAFHDWTASCAPATRWAPPSRRPRDALAAADGSAGTAYPVGRGRIVHIARAEDAARAVAVLSEELDLVRFTKSDPRLDLTIHLNADDPDRFVFFVANPTAEAIDAEVVPSISLGSVTEIWEGRPVAVVDGVLREPMDPYSIGTLREPAVGPEEKTTCCTRTR